MNEKEFDDIFTEVGIECFEKLNEYEKKMKVKNPNFKIAEGFVFTVVMTIKDELRKRLVD